MTAWDIGLIFVVLVLGSFVIGFIETWWEQHKRDKEQRR